MYSATRLFHHPLLGVDTLYVDLDRPGAAGNVFVYPVRSVDWSALYLFLRQDKYVKVRVSEPDEPALAEPPGEALVRALAGGIEVPAESPFMARLRQLQRQAEAGH